MNLQLGDVFDNFVKVSEEEFHINHKCMILVKKLMNISGGFSKFWVKTYLLLPVRNPIQWSKPFHFGAKNLAMAKHHMYDSN